MLYVNIRRNQNVNQSTNDFILSYNEMNSFTRPSVELLSKKKIQLEFSKNNDQLCNSHLNIFLFIRRRNRKSKNKERVIILHYWDESFRRDYILWWVQQVMLSCFFFAITIFIIFTMKTPKKHRKHIYICNPYRKTSW